MQKTHKFLDSTHNHARCVDKAVQAATTLCERQGLRFTPIRKRVLQLVWASHAPMAAYELLKALRKEKGNAEAPTIYRALDFLLQHGMVHKIESMNAYVGCDHPGNTHTGQFLICTECNQVLEQESHDLRLIISRNALSYNFTIISQTIEIMGVCERCQT
jgi:Fur family zinc uptake transcriptional regulator